MTTTHTLPPPFTTPSPLTTTTTPSQPPTTANATTPPPPQTRLITQGAEALIYHTTFLTPSTPVALKHRPRKSYRHPTLDTRLTKARVLAEARVLLKCRREGVPVPGVLGADWEDGWLALEWVEGVSLRAGLDGWLRQGEGEIVGTRGERQGELLDLMGRVGRVVGRMHEVGVVHGDLTTSNIMLRRGARVEGEGAAGKTEHLDGEVVLIDFGLGVQSVQDEDRAVDLYVLERAFGSTHPEAEGLFEEVLKSYGQSYKQGKSVLRRLDDVRLRGRKKSMLG